MRHRRYQPVPGQGEWREWRGRGWDLGGVRGSDACAVGDRVVQKLGAGTQVSGITLSSEQVNR